MTTDSQSHLQDVIDLTAADCDRSPAVFLSIQQTVGAGRVWDVLDLCPEVGCCSLLQFLYRVRSDNMLELGGTFESFVDAFFGFISELLTSIFSSLTSIFSGLSVAA